MAKQKNAKRKDNRIKSAVYIGRIDGKKKFKYVYGYTNKEVEAKKNELLVAIGKGLDVTAELETFSEWAEKFISLKSLDVSQSQANVYRSAVDHLNCYIGNTQITKIKSIHIQEAINSLAKLNPNTNKPASKSTLEVIKNTVNQVCKLAIENRVMDYNPVAAVKIPRSAPAESRRALTSEEQKWILETPHRAQRAAMLMMYAGLRRGELIPLTWNDIDIKKKTLNINKAVEKVDGQFQIKQSGKTESSMRIVHIPQQLVDFLQGEKREGIYVCVNKKGQMHTVSSFTKMWSSYLADLNIKYGDFSNYERFSKKVKSVKLKANMILMECLLLSPKLHLIGSGTPLHLSYIWLE